MYITDLYEDVCDAYDGDDSQFLKDLWWDGANDFAKIIETGESTTEHKSSYQDFIFQMNSDGRIFRYTIVSDNCGYWGDGETYWDESDVEEVEKKAVTVYQWVRVKRD